MLFNQFLIRKYFIFAHCTCWTNLLQVWMNAKIHRNNISLEFVYFILSYILFWVVIWRKRTRRLRRDKWELTGQLNSYCFIEYFFANYSCMSLKCERIFIPAPRTLLFPDGCNSFVSRTICESLEWFRLNLCYFKW